MVVSFADPVVTVDGNNGGAGFDCQDVITAVGDTSRAESLLNSSGTKVFRFTDITFQINANSLFRDFSAIILHTLSGSAEAYTFSESSSVAEFGFLDESSPFTPLAPVTITGISVGEANLESACQYSFLSNNSGQTFSDGGAGSFRMYGGLLRFRDTDSEGKNSTYTVKLPESSSIIQCNVENFGGAELYGNYRLQECTFKSSRTQIGLSPRANSSEINRDIIVSDCNVALHLTGSSTSSMREVGLRGNTFDISVDEYAGSFTLIDSDTISSISGTIMDFVGDGEVIEANSYNFSVIDSAGNPVSNIVALVYQNSSEGSVVFGSEQTTRPYDEVIVTRGLYNSTYSQSRNDFGNAAIRLRQYGLKWLDIEKVPGEVGLKDSFIINSSSFVSESAASASTITGITVDTGSNEIQFSETRNSQQTYDYLQWALSQTGANALQIPELFKTKDGVSYTLPDSWSVTGLEFLELGNAVVINRYVPITITGVISGSTAAVVGQTGSLWETLITKDAADTSVTLATPYNAGQTIIIQSRLAGYVPYETITTVSPTGQTVAANMRVDTNYSASFL